MEANGSAGEQD